jgi:uncharacterized membrane protein
MSISYVVGESHWRSASKGVTYRVFATLVTTTVSFLMTGSVKTAAIIGSTEVTAKVLLYWAHERIWARITWGRRGRVMVADGAGERLASPIEAANEARGLAGQEAVPLPVGIDLGVRNLALGVTADEPSPTL